MTRRGFFSNLIPSRWIATTTSPATSRAARTPTRSSANPAGQIAVIAGRHCLAYQGSFCSTCRERCPVEGAVVIERGLPRINPDLCNGCRICHELCPAPTNAILMVDKGPEGKPRAVRATPLAASGPAEVHHVSTSNLRHLTHTASSEHV